MFRGYWVVFLLVCASTSAATAQQSRSFKCRYLDGPVLSAVAVNVWENRVTVDNSQIAVELADGQTIRILPSAIHSIGYLRRVWRDEVVVGGGVLIPWILPARGAFGKSTDHHVLLRYTDQAGETQLHVQFDKSEYAAALTMLQGMTRAPIEVAADDRRYLPREMPTRESALLPAAFATRQTRPNPLESTTIAFGPDGNMLAAGTAAGRVLLWRLNGDVAVRELGSHSGRVGRVSFTPNGEAVMSVAADRTMSWDIGTADSIGTPIRVSEGHRPSVISPDAKLAAALLADARHITFWDLLRDVATDDQLVSEYPIKTLTFGPDAATLVANGFSNDQVTVWNLATRSMTPVRVKHAGYLRDIAFARGSTLLALRYLWPDAHVQVVDLSTGRVVQIIHNCDAMTLSRDGLRLACAGHGQLAVWNVTGSQKLRSIEIHGRIGAIALNTTGTIIAATRADGSIVLWDVSTGHATGDVLRYGSERLRPER